MQRTFLKNSTAIALSLSLAAPMPAAAQEISQGPCAGLEGEARAECLAEAAPGEGGAPEADEDDREAEAAEAEGGTPPADTAEGGEADPAQAGVAAPGADGGAAEREATAGAGTPAPEAIGQETAPEQTADPAADGAEAEEAAADAEAPAGGEAETAAETEPSTTADDAPAAEAETDAPANGEAETAAETEAPAPADAPEQTGGVAAAAASGEAQPDETVTKTVTEEQARNSGEEFETGIEEGMAGDGTGTAAREEEDGDDDEGLSDFQKLALGAAGLVGLGVLLDRGDEVVASTGDRVVVQRDDGEYYVMRDDNALIRRPGTELETQRFSDGSTRVIATREDGTQIVTIRAPTGGVLRRTRILPDGRRVVLFDHTDPSRPVEIDGLPQSEARTVELDQSYTDRDLREALLAAELEGLDRRFSLSQIRDTEAVRNLVPALELEAITFPSGSAAIPPQEAEDLSAIGTAMQEAIQEDPGEVFLIEGYTDAVGPAPYNLVLSDRRAESVALALTEYFDVPPENLLIQGYGESNLKVQTQEAEQANRRVTVRRITPLLQAAEAR